MSCSNIDFCVLHIFLETHSLMKRACSGPYPRRLSGAPYERGKPALCCRWNAFPGKGSPKVLWYLCRHPFCEANAMARFKCIVSLSWGREGIYSSNRFLLIVTDSLDTVIQSKSVPHQDNSMLPSFWCQKWEHQSEEKRNQRE